MTDIMASSALLLAFCGLPGAGKTTLAKALVEAVNEDPSLLPFTEVQHVSFDDEYAREAAESLGKGAGGVLLWSPAIWHTSRASAMRQIREALVAATGERKPERIAESSGQNFNSTAESITSVRPPPQRTILLVDDNLFLRSMRKPLYRLSQEVGAGFLVLHLHVPVEEANRRNSAREAEQQVSEATMARMASKFELPLCGCRLGPSASSKGGSASSGPSSSSHYATAAEPLHTRCIPAADSSKDETLSSLVAILQNGDSWRPPADLLPSIVDDARRKTIEASRAATAASLLHHCDLVLRQCVREAATKATEGAATAAKHANEARSWAMKELKTSLGRQLHRDEDDEEDDGDDRRSSCEALAGFYFERHYLFLKSAAALEGKSSATPINKEATNPAATPKR